MNAKFVAVETLELARFQANPSSVEGLFHDETLIPEAFVKASKTLQDRMRAIDPQMMADSLSKLDPSLQQMLAERLGKTPAELARGLAGDEMLKLIEERRSSLSARKSSTTSAHPALSLDKAWHGVHYILCGEAEPGATLLSQVVLGGAALGDDDEGFAGYGPARSFTAAQVAEIAGALKRADLESEAAARFDAQQMSDLGIYPGFRPSDAEWVLDGLRRLRDFYSDAAAHGRAVVTCLV